MNHTNSSPKILFIMDFYVPDVSAIGQLLHELCIDINDKYEISVIAMQSCNKRIMLKLFEKEIIDNVTIYRIHTKKLNKNSKISRISNILEFFIKAFISMMRIKKHDIVFSTSQPPIMAGVLGALYKKLKRSRFIYNIQDFNPEQNEAVGFVKSKTINKLIRRIDTYSCKFSDKIVIVGRDMIETLRKRGITEPWKYRIINNWADDSLIKPDSGPDVLNFRKKISSCVPQKMVMYSGNIGLYYDLENLIKVIGNFRSRKDVAFVFVGEGAKKKYLEEYVRDNCIENIVFLPHQPKDMLPVTLNCADIHIVSSKKGIKGVSVPSKLYGVMAAGKAVIGVVEEKSEAWYLIKESDCGITVEPDDYKGFENALLSMLDSSKEEIKNLGAKARIYLDSNLRKERAVSAYKNLFEELLQKGKN